MPRISAGLYVVATPIGNLEDFTPRAIKILTEVSFILAENTRHSRKLLQHYGIKSPLWVYHDHNERQLVPRVINKIRSGKAVALISDAGTPLISDPGFRLVTTVHSEGLDIFPVPGPCALICALSASGLPTDRFVFEGFLPNKQHARRSRLTELAAEDRTLIFYEVPHRIHNCLEDMIACLGENRIATIARELTKKFETIHRDSLQNLLSWLTEDPIRQKGEFVLLVQGIQYERASKTESTRVLNILLQTLTVKDAVNIAAEILQVKKNTLYKLALELTGIKS
jgi:16S rRNA (cytidine1402-2'-O)-methyltransferase